MSRFAGKRVHFIGIGGCGMAGLARMLLDAGAIVTGSDPNFNEAAMELARRGAKITRTQLGELLTREVDLVVRTAAVPDANPEFLAARKLGLEHLKYAQLLGQVMQERFAIAVSGTHGKTTTTSLISHALVRCGVDPSFVIGGTVPQLGGSSRSGAGQSFVVEACEYDRSFHNLHPTVCLITNIEADHLDCYKDLDDIIASFRHFASLVPPSGLILANGQDPNVAKGVEGVSQRVERVVVRTATDDAGVTGADWVTVPLAPHNGCHCGIVHYQGKPVATLRLSIPGHHNLYNATLALAACRTAGVDLERAAEAINGFAGVDRRMSRIGEYRGATIVDDYGHHPTEIAATLKALRERYRPNRILCVFQPHQHSRTRTLLDEFAVCFKDADLALIADIYSVRDSDEEKRLTSARTLVDRINAAGHGQQQHQQKALHIPTLPQMVEYLKQNAGRGDLILTIGAGNVCDVAHELANLSESSPV
ncbi:MAG TPA: UDP-N-acetylmuramate--L-alanine ligase [Tepidisphaeraceae bacterium]